MSVVSSIFKFLQFNKKNWKAVALSLLAATVFWFFNSLNKTYTTSLSFPVEFQYDRDNFIPVAQLPVAVNMNVTGLGWNLLRRSAGVKVPSLVFPLEQPTEVKKIVGSTLPALFVNQLPDLQINFVATDTLHVDIEPFDGRWLALTTASLSNILRKGYGLSSNATLTPDSLFVQGPQRIIKALPNPYAIAIDSRNIDESFEMALSIPFISDLITTDQATVQLSVSVEKLVLIKDSVKVQVVNVPRGIRPAININRIHYILSMPESFSHGGYSREGISALLDLSQMKKRKSRVVPTLSGIPPFTNIVQVDSIEVSY
jgi:hypothetical protein